MSMKNLLNSAPGEKKEAKNPRKNRGTKKDKPKRRTFEAPRLERYYVVSALTNAQSGLTFG